MTSVVWNSLEERHKERRERIAIAALQGLLASDTTRARFDHDMAQHAVALADALIAELDKSEKKP